MRIWFAIGVLFVHSGCSTRPVHCAAHLRRINPPPLALAAPVKRVLPASDAGRPLGTRAVGNRP
jgi:hypothetical protein